MFNHKTNFGGHKNNKHYINWITNPHSASDTCLYCLAFRMCLWPNKERAKCSMVDDCWNWLKPFGLCAHNVHNPLVAHQIHSVPMYAMRFGCFSVDDMVTMTVYWNGWDSANNCRRLPRAMPANQVHQFDQQQTWAALTECVAICIMRGMIVGWTVCAMPEITGNHRSAK